MLHSAPPHEMVKSRFSLAIIFWATQYLCTLISLCLRHSGKLVAPEKLVFDVGFHGYQLCHCVLVQAQWLQDKSPGSEGCTPQRQANLRGSSNLQLPPSKTFTVPVLSKNNIEPSVQVMECQTCLWKLCGLSFWLFSGTEGLRKCVSASGGLWIIN